MRARSLVLAGGVLALVALVVAAVIARALDVRRYRAEFVERVRAATSRQVSVGGGFRLGIGWRPTLSATDVTLANAPWGSRPFMMRARRIEIDFSLVSLLLGRLDVSRLVVVGADVLFETDAEGRGNWLMAPERGGPASAPVLHRIRIENSSFTYRDGRSGREAAFRIAKIAGTVDQRARPISLEISSVLDGRELAISGTIGSPRALLASTPAPFDLRIRVGRTDLHAEGSTVLAAQPPQMKVALVSRSLDLGDLLPTGPSAGSVLALDALRAVNADVGLWAASAKLGNVRIEDLRVDAFLRDGALRVAPIEGRAARGWVQADASVDARAGEPATSLRVEAYRVELAALFQELGLAPVLDGAAVLEADLQSRGDSLRAWIDRASGTVTFVMDRGRLESSALDRVAPDLLPTVAPWVERERDTPVNCLIGRMDVAGGVARSKVLVLDTPRITIVGAGGADLKAGTVSLRFDPSLKDMNLLRFAVPFRVEGSIASPRTSAESFAVLKTLKSTLFRSILLPPTLIARMVALGLDADNPCVQTTSENDRGDPKQALEGVCRFPGRCAKERTIESEEFDGDHSALLLPRRGPAPSRSHAED